MPPADDLPITAQETISMTITSTSLARGGVALALAAVMACGLSACGSSSTSTAASSTAAATPGSGRGMDPALRQKITACLQAAGIAVPTFAPRPSGEARPTGEPRPTGAPGGGRGGGFGAAFNTPQAKAALQACGITLPTRGPSPAGTA
jgi:hypothetical protein